MLSITDISASSASAVSVLSSAVLSALCYKFSTGSGHLGLFRNKTCIIRVVF